MNILHDENSGCKGNILSLIVLYAMFQKLFYLCYLAIIQQNYPFSTRFFSFLYPFLGVQLILQGIICVIDK